MSPTLAEFRSLRWSAGGLPATRLVSQPLGAVLAWVAHRLGLTPSQVTLTGTAVFLATAWLYISLPQGIASAIVVLLLFEIGYALDCADGQLARATNRTSAFGAWLDVSCDYVRNVMLAAAITLWLAQRGIAPTQALLSSSLLLAGLVVQVHTGAFLARQASAGGANDDARSMPRVLVTTFIDTTTQLAVLALLRPWPRLLAAYAAVAGLLYLALAWFLVRRRVSATSAAAR